jgi:phosphonopyruvate decarboxylase
MLSVERLCQIFKEQEFIFFAGVPDSTFKSLMSYLADNKSFQNIISPNEGTAIATCSGYHLATGKIGITYMQNSGLGNCVNPITSLTDPEVYSIPLLLLIGWRGEPGEKDEPQHKKMGRITLPLLDTLEIPYEILSDKLDEAEKQIVRAKVAIAENQSLFALVIKKGTIEKYKQNTDHVQDYEMSREDAIKTIVDKMKENELVVSTTGKTSRELFEYREQLQQGHNYDFLTVGSMGHSSSIALGIATQTKKRVYIFDGDGATIMHMGALTTIGYSNQKNIYHIVFDNESYDSTGGQPTLSPNVKFCTIAKSCGYKEAKEVSTKEELSNLMDEIQDKEGPYLVVVKTKKGARKDLGRPTTTPIQNKQELMNFLSK